MIFYFNFRKRWNYKWIKWSNLKYIYSFHFEIIFSWKIQIFSGQVPGAGSSLKGSFSWSSSLTSSSSRQIATRFQQVNGMSIYMESSELQVNWPNVSASEQVKWKKNTPAVIQMRKKSSEMVLKWKDCQTASVSSEGCLSSKKSVKWKLNQVKTWPSERSVKCKPCQMKRLVKWLLASVKGPSSEYFVKWKVGQVNVWTSTVNLQHHHSWDMKAYIYIHIKIWIDKWRKMPPGSFPRHLLPWESAPLQVETPNHEATMEVLGLCKWSLKWELKRSSFYVKRSSEIPSKVPSESQNPSWNVGIKWSVKQKSSENWNGMVTCRGPVKCQVTWQMQVETELAQT